MKNSLNINEVIDDLIINKCKHLVLENLENVEHLHKTIHDNKELLLDKKYQESTDALITDSYRLLCLARKLKVVNNPNLIKHDSIEGSEDNS